MSRLFEDIVGPRNISLAYQVLRKRYYDPMTKRFSFRPGPDGEGFEQFEANLEKSLERVQQRVRGDGFAFGPYFERPIRGSRKDWPVGHFSLCDKVLFRAIYQIVAPAYDHIFSDSLLSYRKGEGAWDSILKAMRMIRRDNGNVWVFRTDVRNYVVRMDLRILREQLCKLFADEPEVLRLFLAFVDQPRIVDGALRPREVGSQPGAELTTFFYNLYLNDLDHYMVRSEFRYSRYGDDIIVWGRDENEARSAKRIIAEFCEKMMLDLHTAKTFIAAPGEQYEYLGYNFRGLTFTVSKNSLGNLKKWVHHRLQKGRYKTLKQHRLGEEETLRLIIDDFQSARNTQKLVSWLRYFQLISDPSQLKAVDKIIRERIGACVTQRFTQRNYKLVPSQKLRKQGLRSLVSLHFLMKRGRPLPPDVLQKLDGRTLFSPRIHGTTKS